MAGDCRNLPKLFYSNTGLIILWHSENRKCTMVGRFLTYLTASRWVGSTWDTQREKILCDWWGCDLLHCPILGWSCLDTQKSATRGGGGADRHVICLAPQSSSHRGQDWRTCLSLDCMPQGLEKKKKERKVKKKKKSSETQDNGQEAKTKGLLSDKLCFFLFFFLLQVFCLFLFCW